MWELEAALSLSYSQPESLSESSSPKLSKEYTVKWGALILSVFAT